MTAWPKRLIEVDLPIARISAHARREKSIRHGHISTLHIWWARRPLAACRAVICAALWPDPADEHCPQSFRDAAATHLIAFAKRVNPDRITDEKRQLQETLSPESRTRWELFARLSVGRIANPSSAPGRIGNPSYEDNALDPTDPAHQNVLRFALLDFIADFANWDNSTVPAYLETSRALTQAAHEALGGEPGTRPLVVDPFAGGGSIPLEALRVGADAFASDLNPVAVLLNKVVLEYIPKYGQKLADEVRKWGQWIKEQAEKELAEFYPKDPDGATPIAYLWARTVLCEGPGCGVEVPLIKSLWLGKKPHNPWALQLIPERTRKRIEVQIVRKKLLEEETKGTVRRGSVTCPCCGYTTPVSHVRKQLLERLGGTRDARLLCVVTTRVDEAGRFYRLPTSVDIEAVRAAKAALDCRKRSTPGRFSLVPSEPTPAGGGRGAGRAFSQRAYGMDTFETLFTPRQALVLTTLCEKVRAVGEQLRKEDYDGMAEAVQLVLAFNTSKIADWCSALSTWASPASKETIRNTFSRPAITIAWDFAEAYPFAGSSGGWMHNLEFLVSPIEAEASWPLRGGTAIAADAVASPLADQSANALITDPPYYDAIPYADLSDFFLVWLARSLGGSSLAESCSTLAPKEGECVLDETKGHDQAFFERTMTKALAEGHRVTWSKGIGVIVFAHKSTVGWEAQLKALIDAGWIVSGSWPLDTERQGRMRANEAAALASSVHLVCRPRTSNDPGDWRDVLAELPQRMHEWMPRLASEGVVGADAIFACLGPALEIFSRYSRVERANGDEVLLKEYLEHVWAAVSKEALSTIFHDADASGLEPDARLTAMWLWTVGGGAPAANGKPAEEDVADDEGAEEEEKESGKTATARGFTLEFDAARKIAQGLGIHLERSESIVEVKGDKARLLAVAERTKYLFGKDTEAGPTGGKKAKRKPKQGTFFDDLDAAERTEGGWKELKGPPPGTTVLDRLHQAMILFGAQRGEPLKRFLVEEGVGKDARFWKLAQSLAALYPPGTDERRWVEGVLARKKGLGL